MRRVRLITFVCSSFPIRLLPRLLVPAPLPAPSQPQISLPSLPCSVSITITNLSSFGPMVNARLPHRIRKFSLHLFALVGFWVFVFPALADCG